MKRKSIVWLMMSCLVLSLTGCSAVKEAEAVASDIVKENMQEGEEAKPTEETEEIEETEETKDYPVLGGEEITDYEGYEYLYEEMLMTDSEENQKTGKMENQELKVYIPKGDYTNVNRNTATGGTLGVEFEVQLQPYIRYDKDDYLLAENLQYYLEEEYDPFYASDYKDLVIGEVESIDDKTVRATAEYCMYDDWDDNYSTIFATYYLAEIKDDVTVLVETRINSEEVTGKTPQLLEELEKYYQFEISWDLDKATQKQESFLAGGGDNTVSTGYILFELPEDWERDSSYGDYSTYAYAPEGDAEFAGCVITFNDEYVSSDSSGSLKDLLMNEEFTKDYIKEIFGESIQDLVIEDYGTTCLGDAVKMSFTVSEESISGVYEVYMMADEYNMYTVEAIQIDNATDDPFVVVKDILANGIKNER